MKFEFHFQVKKHKTNLKFSIPILILISIILFDFSLKEISKPSILNRSLSRLINYLLQTPMEPWPHLFPSVQVALFKFAPSKFAFVIFAEEKSASIKFAF